MRWKIGIVIFALSGALGAAESTTPESGARTGTPTFVRNEPRTEIFFKDLKDSAWIADDSKHNAFQRVFLDAMKKNRPVKFTVDSKNRRVIAIDELTELQKAETEPAGGQK